MIGNSEKRRENEVEYTREEFGDRYLTESSESESDRKKKRKWEHFSEKLMRCVLRKQEDLHRTFLEAIEKFECERLARQEEWKMQEMARIRRERELLMQERSISAAKDAAILACLQKISDQGKLVHAKEGQMEENPNEENMSEDPSQGDPIQEDLSQDPSPENPSQENMSREDPSQENRIQGNPSQDKKALYINEKDLGESSSSRWPKEEVEALITIRSSLDLRCGKNGTKGRLWEDVSAAMKKIGYHRNATRCKEKWENINKYYRRVKDRNKERPIDSKTCPYFHLLDDLYRKRTMRLNHGADTSVGDLEPEEILMHMMNRPP